MTNSSAHDAALRQCGRLPVWLTEEALAAALTLRLVFRLVLRRTEGLTGSLLALLGLDLAAPDHSTLSRRADTLAVVPWARCSPLAPAG